MRSIKVADEIYREFLDQKILLETELTDEQFMALILEGRRRAIQTATINRVKRSMGETDGSPY